jgi:ribonuclease G
MEKKILVSVDDYEMRVAILENSQLVEYFLERADNRRMAGNIYKGKVTAIAQGIEAAFVDIGIGRNAFLFVSDVSPQIDDEFSKMMVEEDEETEEDLERPLLPPVSISELLKEGQEILIQMEKEPIGAKGSRVTTNISLPGKYLVLLPNTTHIGISRRIEDPVERQRLKDMAEQLCPDGMGLIVRTVAEGREKDEFASDIETLQQLWGRLTRQSETSKAPALIHREAGLAIRLVRDMLNDEVTDLIVDEPDVYEQVLDYTEAMMPRLRSRVKLWKNKHPLFVAMGIEAEISGLMNKKVWLNCGGYIVIEETEALVAIDVNTGRYLGSRNLEETVLVTNLEAAAEIARQLRLRDIGGIVIIDFIDMQRLENREMVLNRLQDCLKRDRSKTHVLEITELGLVQMTRKRVRRSLNKSLTQACPYCKREGTILSLSSMTIKVFRRIEEICRKTAMKEVALHVHPRLAAHINEERNEQLRNLERRYRKVLRVFPAKELHFEEMRDEQSYDSATSLGLT